VPVSEVHAAEYEHRSGDIPARWHIRGCWRGSLQT
jgi:hypothetical protein